MFLKHEPFSGWRNRLKDWLIKNEPRFKPLYVIRYQFFSCAFCFCLTSGFLCAIVGACQLVWVALFAVTVFISETTIKRKL